MPNGSNKFSEEQNGPEGGNTVLRIHSTYRRSREEDPRLVSLLCHRLALPSSFNPLLLLLHRCTVSLIADKVRT